MTSEELRSALSRLRYPADMRRSDPPLDLRKAMMRTSTPGVGIALIDGGEIATTWCEGVRQVGRPEPVTETTRFQSGSISKSVSAAVALRLVAEGVLDLDQDVNDTLRSWKVPANGGWQPRVTLRQLLSHTAGTTVGGFPGYGEGVVVPTVPDVLDGRGNTLPIRVMSLPGLQFCYSGGGYTIMQQLLVDATGTEFPALAADLVLGPVGMKDSTFVQLPAGSLADAHVSGHRIGLVPVRGGHHVYPEMAAAGLWSTPTDLARFFIALRNSWAGRPDALLPPSIIAQMVDPDATNQPYGLGVALAEPGQAASIGHSGDDQGFQNLARLFLESGQGVVVMTNADSGHWLIGEAIVPALEEAFGWPRPADDDAEAPAPALEDLAGRYPHDRGVLEIQRAGDELELVHPGQPPVRLSRSGDGWSAPDLCLDIRFPAPEPGEPRRLVVRQFGVQNTDIEAQRETS